ncbi:TIR domain-containing protein [Haliea sp. E17]|uniref:TIR domain-containing protein n=1 Tax=Haliea sp. E17 TaxID=3401576 RepID=UPI003AADEE08
MHRKYYAFISYSHRDRRWADWLHRGLETFRLPRRMRAHSGRALPARLTPIFRDREELASAADLGARVEQALADSDALIVICSPDAARSRWVNQEVLEFKRLGREERIFCLLVAGEPGASEIAGREDEECFVPALRFALEADGELGERSIEPIAADLRPGGDGRSSARLKLIAGLLEVGYDELRQRELKRRYRRLLAISAGLLLGMLLTGWLAVNAVLARQDAERNREKAEELIGFMLGDLTRNLRAVGRLDVFDAIGDEALQYFESLTEQDLTSRTLAQRAEALALIGEIAIDRSHLEEAVRAFSESVEQARALSQREPAEPRWLLQLASSELWLGLAHWQQGDLEKGLAHFRQSLAVANSAADLSPDNLQVLNVQSGAHNNIAQVLERRGDLKGARNEYQTVLSLQQRVLALDPDNPEWKIELGFAFNTLGKVELQLGHLQVAREHYRQDLALKREVLASNPQHRLWQRYLAMSEAHMAELAEFMGDVDGAIDYNEHALDLDSELVEQEPEHVGRRRSLASLQVRRGRLARLQGDLQAAASLQEGALRDLATLAASDSSDYGNIHAMAGARLALADTLAAQGLGEGAITAVRTAITELHALAQRDQSNVQAGIDLAAGEIALARLLDATGDTDRAQTLFTSALARIDSNSPKSDPQVLHLRIEALTGLGRSVLARNAAARLLATGYRQPDFVDLANTLGVAADAAALQTD